jgi:hypothetical protein
LMPNRFQSKAIINILAFGPKSNQQLTTAYTASV